MVPEADGLLHGQQPADRRSCSPPLPALVTPVPTHMASPKAEQALQVNVSPKGMLGSSFAFLSPNSAAYVDLGGSGNETISHIYENGLPSPPKRYPRPLPSRHHCVFNSELGRVTVMFNSFDASLPRILRYVPQTLLPR